MLLWTVLLVICWKSLFTVRCEPNDVKILIIFVNLVKINRELQATWLQLGKDLSLTLVLWTDNENLLPSWKFIFNTLFHFITILLFSFIFCFFLDLWANGFFTFYLGKCRFLCYFFLKRWLWKMCKCVTDNYLLRKYLFIDLLQSDC